MAGSGAPGSRGVGDGAAAAALAGPALAGAPPVKGGSTSISKVASLAST
jgi:hypothetical protein